MAQAQRLGCDRAMRGTWGQSCRKAGRVSRTGMGRDCAPRWHTRVEPWHYRLVEHVCVVGCRLGQCALGTPTHLQRVVREGWGRRMTQATASRGRGHLQCHQGRHKVLLARCWVLPCAMAQDRDMATQRCPRHTLLS